MKYRNEIYHAVWMLMTYGIWITMAKAAIRYSGNLLSMIGCPNDDTYPHIITVSTYLHPR